ncbi:MAG: hypothetical protein AAF298_21110 [Cyanobacteria bacterium P01_A01_bin.40]
MLKNIIEILKELEIFKQRPGLFIALSCLLVFLFSLKPVLEALNSSSDFLNKVQSRKFIKYKEIFESTLASNENKNLAKEKIDSFHFKQLTGIDVSKDFRCLLCSLANNSQDKNIWLYIRHTIKYLKLENNSLIIRQETIAEKISHYFYYLIAIFCLILTFICIYLLIFIGLKCHSFITVLFAFIFYFFSLLALQNTRYIDYLEKIKQEINYHD